MEDQLTSSNMKLNEVQPEGFCNEPRVLSREVWQLNSQVAALCDAIARLCELQREMAKKLDTIASNPINGV